MLHSTQHTRAMAASLASQDWDMLPAEGAVQAEEATLDKKQAIQRLQECILATVGGLAERGAYEGAIRDAILTDTALVKALDWDLVDHMRKQLKKLTNDGRLRMKYGAYKPGNAESIAAAKKKQEKEARKVQKEKERKAAAKRAWEQRHGSVGVGGSQQQQQDKRPAVVEGAADSVAAWDHLLHGLRDLASETRGQYAAQLAAAGLTVEAFGQVGPDYLAFLHTGVQGTIPAVHFAMIHQLARQ